MLTLHWNLRRSALVLGRKRAGRWTCLWLGPSKGRSQSGWRIYLKLYKYSKVIDFLRRSVFKKNRQFGKFYGFGDWITPTGLKNVANISKLTVCKFDEFTKNKNVMAIWKPQALKLCELGWGVVGETIPFSRYFAWPKVSKLPNFIRLVPMSWTVMKNVFPDLSSIFPWT